jgi:hypothetical protein
MKGNLWKCCHCDERRVVPSLVRDHERIKHPGKSSCIHSTVTPARPTPVRPGGRF